jgi:hypothetical protein
MEWNHCDLVCDTEDDLDRLDLPFGLDAPANQHMGGLCVTAQASHRPD